MTPQPSYSSLIQHILQGRYRAGACETCQRRKGGQQAARLAARPVCMERARSNASIHVGTNGMSVATTIGKGIAWNNVATIVAAS